MSSPRYDAVVVGAGPNGLAAAITLARAGRSVVVFERADTVGGGARSRELTLPGFVHDVCSAIHPLAAGSPFFRTLPLEHHGLEWIHPPVPLAHPLDGGGAVLLRRSVGETARALGRDGPAYERLVGPFVERWNAVARDVLGPRRFPRHPLLLARVGLLAIRPAERLCRSRFREEPARALFAGLAAHSMLPLDRPLTTGFGLMLAVAGHAVGWPMPRGGSQRLADALASYLRSLGGEIVTGADVASIDALPQARDVLLDLTPRQILAVAGHRLPAAYRRRLARYRYGAGAFKVDLALDGPIPWAAPECAQAGTLHVGGALREIAAAEAAPWQGRDSPEPFVLVAQQSLADPTRAPAGKHTVWAYCHVAPGSRTDATGAIERRIERFAPGFRDRILARHVMAPADLERYNPNLVGGDIGGGAQDVWQAFARPTLRTYRTPVPGLYICSASTPPGGGVHGMCGHLAARAALRRGGGSRGAPPVDDPRRGSYIEGGPPDGGPPTGQQVGPPEGGPHDRGTGRAA